MTSIVPYRKKLPQPRKQRQHDRIVPTKKGKRKITVNPGNRPIDAVGERRVNRRNVDKRTIKRLAKEAVITLPKKQKKYFIDNVDDIWETAAKSAIRTKQGVTAKDLKDVYGNYLASLFRQYNDGTLKEDSFKEELKALKDTLEGKKEVGMMLEIINVLKNRLDHATGNLLSQMLLEMDNRTFFEFGETEVDVAKNERKAFIEDFIGDMIKYYLGEMSKAQMREEWPLMTRHPEIERFMNA